MSPDRSRPGRSGACWDGGRAKTFKGKARRSRDFEIEIIGEVGKGGEEWEGGNETGVGIADTYNILVALHPRCHGRRKKVGQTNRTLFWIQIARPQYHMDL